MIRQAAVEDLGCPVIICDACHKPIDSEHPGNYLWDYQDERVHFHVHKGRCDHAIDPPQELYSSEMESWVAQLYYNYRNPLPVPFREAYSSRTRS